MQIVIILTRNLYENIKLKTTCKFQEQSVLCKNLVFALFYFSLLWLLHLKKVKWPYSSSLACFAK